MGIKGTTVLMVAPDKAALTIRPVRVWPEKRMMVGERHLGDRMRSFLSPSILCRIMDPLGLLHTRGTLKLWFSACTLTFPAHQAFLSNSLGVRRPELLRLLHKLRSRANFKNPYYHFNLMAQ